MNKLKLTLRTCAFALSTVFLSHNASAQFEIDQLSFGAGIGYTGYTQDVGGSLSFNLRGNYELDEVNSVVLSYNIQLPTSREYEVIANALSSSTNPRSVEGLLSQKINFMNFALDYHRYFVGDIEEDFGIYGLAGIGLTFAKRELEYSGFDQSLYASLPLVNDGKESFSGFMINLGAGCNFNLNDQIALFGEIKGAIPAGNEYNSQGNSTITNPLPFSFISAVGVRFNVFD